MQKQEQEVELFLDSVKSEHTKRTYKSYLKKYMELTGLENLLHENNPRLIEKEIREFIIKMKKQGMTFTALKNYTTVVFSFYKIHDIATRYLLQRQLLAFCMKLTGSCQVMYV
ncbi:MAG: hypothetical protein E6L04_05300 [Thaumarchaeota archaeon]|nr:MAG: hypothetical protein E6L04_05300 [Nitrososphaerota archaeon]